MRVTLSRGRCEQRRVTGKEATATEWYQPPRLQCDRATGPMADQNTFTKKKEMKVGIPNAIRINFAKDLATIPG